MCLESNHLIPKRVKEPIVVIKKVSKVLEEGHEVYKPHFITRYLSLVDEKYRLRIDNKFRYRLGEKKVISLWDISLKDILLHQIGKGFIHSIKYPSKEFFETGITSQSNTHYISDSRYNLKEYGGAYIKCIIPKGTWYYTNYTGEEFASKCIIPLEDVTEDILKSREKIVYEKY